MVASCTYYTLSQSRPHGVQLTSRHDDALWSRQGSLINGLPGRLHARVTFLGLKTTLELLCRGSLPPWPDISKWRRHARCLLHSQQGCCCCSLARLFWLSCCAAASSSGNSRSGWKGPNRSLPFPLRPPSSRALHGRARRSAKKRGRIHRASPPPLLSSSPCRQAGRGGGPPDLACF